jgi:predicted lipoprotein with Yx(FWY)xxD motif
MSVNGLEGNMTRLRGVGLAVGVAAFATSSVALGAELSAHATRTTTIRLAQTHLGKILVSPSGATLFMFTRDRANTDACARINGCSTVWPVLKSEGTLTAGRGLRSALLSTIKLSSGARQVSYDGHPLYTYSLSTSPGDTSYVGANEFGGRWYALDAAGRAVK